MTRPATFVAEGRPTQWRVQLAKPVDYDVPIRGTVVPGPSPSLNGRDVPLSWLGDHSEPGDRGLPLDRLGPYVVGKIKPGTTSALLTIPTSNDSRKEGRESVTLRIEVQHKTFSRAIYVRASD